MTPGPNYIYKCPSCSNLLTKGSLNSGNTIGAQRYSDGRVIAPMLPKFPNLTKCKKCDNIFWISKLKEIGSYNWLLKIDPELLNDKELSSELREERNEINPEWLNADEAEFLQIEDYIKALDLGLTENIAEESFIRCQIWWAFNDRVRNGKSLFNNESDKLIWQRNCKILLNLLDIKDVNQKIQLAEINRNLGYFEKCIKIISSLESDKWNWLIAQYINESKKKNKGIFELSYESIN